MKRMDIAEFVSARLDDTQLAAEAALEGPPPGEFAGYITREQAFAMQILADVKAKRARLAAYIAAREAVVRHAGPYMAGVADGLGVAVKGDAATDSHHPDYDPEWST
jgi:hypothetical protein